MFSRRGYLKFLIGWTRATFYLAVAFLALFVAATLVDVGLNLGWGFKLADLPYSAGLLLFAVVLYFGCVRFLRWFR